MKFSKKFFLRFSLFPILAFIIFISYSQIFSTFYQQDEWQSLGHNIIEGWGILTKDLSIVQIFFAEGRVLSRLFYFVFLGIYQNNVIPVFSYAVLFHALNAWFVYCIVEKLKGGRIAGWTAAAFFAINSVSDETVIWVSAICTIPATTLLLVSILWYLDFLENGNIGKRNFSFVVGILSLFFKETGLFIFLFYPLLYAVWGKAKSFKGVLVTHGPLLLYGGALVIFRIAELFLAPKASAGFVDNQRGSFIFSVIYHSIVYPLTSFVQVFVSPRDLYAFVPTVVRSEYAYFLGTPWFDMVGQSAVADVVSLLGTIVLSLIICFMIFWRKEEERNKRLVFFGATLFFLSFLPYTVLHRFFSYFSSRYYYVGVVAAACIFGYGIAWLYKRLSWVGRVLLLVGVGFYLSYHILEIRKDIHSQVVMATERKAFLSEVQRLHPALQDKTVFYITSDKKYLGEITYPFQNGLGYILEVVYYHTGKVPKTFLRDNFLWDLGDEGYKTSGKFGFGYFEHLDTLGQFVKKGEVKPNIVYGYFYQSETHSMSDITISVREQLATLSAEIQ